jgi:hypothetical protein
VWFLFQTHPLLLIQVVITIGIGEMGPMDFSIGTTQVQNHNYSNGIYSVKLVLTDTIGICTNSVITTVTVNTAPCNAIITDM